MLKLAVIGSIIDRDIDWCEYMLRYGVDSYVIRHAEDRIPDINKSNYFNITSERIIFVKIGIRFFFTIRNYDVMIVNSGSLGFMISFYILFYSIFRFLGWPPYINISSGSNLTEQAVERSFSGILQRFTIRHASMNMLGTQSQSINNAIKLKINNSCIIPYPFFSIKNTDSDSKMKLKDKYGCDYLMFHPSHLDWGIVDSKKTRVSTKGNDRFIRAYARFIHDSKKNVKCIMLYRGSDKEIAKQLIKELDIEEHIIWMEALPQNDFYKLLISVDLVIDQFDVGSLGQIAAEALHNGVPVMMYLNEKTMRLRYSYMPPVINARTEDQIYEKLSISLSNEYLENIKTECKKWDGIYTWENIVPRYITHLEIAAGKNVLDY